MDFACTHKFLTDLADEPSTNAKKVLLSTFLKDDFFRTVVLLALDSRFHYKIKALPKHTLDFFVENEPLSPKEVLQKLKQFAKQRGVSDAEKQSLVNSCASLDYGVDVVHRIVNKDLRCGVGAKLVNTVMPGLIFEWPYMRCRSHNETNLKRIKYPAIAQIKADGTHIDIVKQDGQITFHSRIGNEYDFLGCLDGQAKKLFTQPIETPGQELPQGVREGVFIGEGLVLDETGANFLSRKEGNGIITKALKGTISKEEAKRIRIQLWEYATLESFFDADPNGVPYSFAFDIVEWACVDNELFSPITTWDVDSYEEVIAHYKEAKEAGLEGLVLKNLDGFFFNTQTGSPDQVKIKAVIGEEFEADFLITGFNSGKKGTRFENGLGSLSYTTECGQISGNVGSGFSHEQRDSWSDEDTVGLIATIRFDHLIESQDKDGFALYAPRFIEFRHDKLKADDLAYVKELTEGK